ncbi:hypothetical protein MNBD_ACTINO01-2177, partial [hydrothermal vent metagenome]
AVGPLFSGESPWIFLFEDEPVVAWGEIYAYSLDEGVSTRIGDALI